MSNSKKDMYFSKESVRRLLRDHYDFKHKGDVTETADGTCRQLFESLSTIKF